MSDPELFKGTAGYYSQYRSQYPEEIFRIIITRFSLTGQVPVLDLGCGTGLLARALSKRGIPVYAVDPDPEMLLEGRSLADKERLSGIVWINGDDYSLSGLSLPPIHLCIMGNSFHWMDRARLLTFLDTLIIQDGGVTIIDRSTGIWTDQTGWKRIVKEVITEFLGPERRAGSGLFTNSKDHISFLLHSTFNRIEKYSIQVTEELTVSQVVGFQLSTSYASPALFANRLEEFCNVLSVRLLEYNPSGLFHNDHEIQLLTGVRGDTKNEEILS